MFVQSKDEIMTKTVCVFGGAASGNHPEYQQEATRLGQMLGARGYEVIYGGGHTGMMGALADGALSSNGTVHGVIPSFLKNREIGHEDIASLTITDTMHERKKIMYDAADAFVVMPGGLGTLDETMEVLTWVQLGLLNAPVLVLNINDYWTPMANMLNHLVKAGFMHSARLDYVRYSTETDALIDHLSELLPA